MKKSQNLINENHLWKVHLFFLMHITLLFGSWNDHQTILKILEIEELVSSWGFQPQNKLNLASKYWFMEAKVIL